MSEMKPEVDDNNPSLPERDPSTAFAEWFKREDFGDKDQLERAFSAGVAFMAGIAASDPRTNSDGEEYVRGLKTALNIAAAMEVVEWMRIGGWSFACTLYEGKLPYASFCRRTAASSRNAEADTLPEAICRAALAAVTHNEPERNAETDQDEVESSVQHESKPSGFAPAGNLEPRIEVAVQWILDHHDGRTDHACAECIGVYDGTSTAIDGFQCVYHRALYVKAFPAASVSHKLADLRQQVSQLQEDKKARNVLLLEMSGRGELLTKEHVNPDALDGLVAAREEFDRLRNIVIRDLRAQVSQLERERDDLKEAVSTYLDLDPVKDVPKWQAASERMAELSGYKGDYEP